MTATAVPRALHLLEPRVPTEAPACGIIERAKCLLDRREATAEVNLRAVSSVRGME